MARIYLNPQVPRGFKKFPPSSSSNKVYTGRRSITRKPFLKNSLQISTRPKSRDLPLRIKYNKMSTTSSSPKRARPTSDVGDQPSKHRRCLSDPVTSSCPREHPARCSSEPPATGLESCGILANMSAKCSPTSFTEADKASYLHRAKNFSYAWSNRRKRDLARRVRHDWTEMSNSAQQGMKNLTGVLCYRHSLFQAIIHCPKVGHWLRGFHSPETCLLDKPTNCVACHLRSMIRAYWSGDSSELTQALRNINKAFKTNGWSPGAFSGQADPEEQYTWLIGQMREQLPRQTYNFFDAFHNFTLNSSTSCTKCGHVSTNQGETEGILSIELQPRIPHGDLSQYLKKYMSYSVTDYKCGKCKDIAEKQRTRNISHSPDIVIIQLKRFDPLGRKDKHPIPFSSTLDLNSYRTTTNKTNSMYKLSAVVSHLGGTGGGHYRCIAKGGDDCWTTFDDMKVTRVKESQALDPGKGKTWTPYLFFFQRETQVRSSHASLVS